MLQFQDLPSARIVFEVTIEGSARKVITIRSALLLDNQLEDEIEVKLDGGGNGNLSRQSDVETRIFRLHY